MQIRKVLKKLKVTQKELAKRIGITPEGLRLRLKNPTYNSIKEIAENIPCEIHELFETSENYAHFYDNDEWLGIRKK